MIGRPSQLIRWLTEQDPEKDYEVKPYRKRRSLTQNAYYWVLNGKLSSALRMGRMETHFHLLRAYAPCTVMTVREDVPLGDYFKYCEVFAHGTLSGKDYKHVRIYKGSSKMDSAEFARLLEGTIEECRQQGIQTLTPAEIERLEFVEPKEAE